MEKHEEMTAMQQSLMDTEAFLSDNYLFRRNVLSGKTEMTPIATSDTWEPVTREVLNTIIRHAKKEGVGGEISPRQNIEEYILSEAIPTFDPIRRYLSQLPRWDGKNHVARLFSRIPGITSEQLSWCSTWMRSMVAHWMGLDTQHGNETVPVLIGPQGCGKSTFAVRILPEHLRPYFLDHINFGNKFDCDMALTHNLLVNIDEFANMGPSQQGKLKQTLSRVKVNGRPIFGRAQEDRVRYASFIATTNDLQPLVDATGSRRFLCLRIHKGMNIDNQTPINHAQLFAQVMHEITEDKIPYWFSNDEVARIQAINLPYFRTDDMEGIILQCFRLPDVGEEGEWLTCRQVVEKMTKVIPSLKRGNSTNIRIGLTLKALGCQTKRSKKGMLYSLIAIAE